MDRRYELIALSLCFVVFGRLLKFSQGFRAELLVTSIISAVNVTEPRSETAPEALVESGLVGSGVVGRDLTVGADAALVLFVEAPASTL